MVSYNLIPGIGIGPIRFGMSFQQVREVMKTEPSAITNEGVIVKRVKGTFYHKDNCFSVFYSDENSTVEYISVSKGGDVILLYKDIDLFAMRADELIDLLAQETPYDDNDPELGYSYVFPILEISLWRSVTPKDIEVDAKELESEEDEFEREMKNLYLEEERKKAEFFDAIGLGKPGYYSNYRLSKSDI